MTQFSQDPVNADDYVETGPYLMVMVLKELLEGMTDDPWPGDPFVWKWFILSVHNGTVVLRWILPVMLANTGIHSAPINPEAENRPINVDLQRT